MLHPCRLRQPIHGAPLFSCAPYLLKKRFGQHFLTDPSILRRIVQFANIGLDDTVVEIGPGTGALTRHLAAAARHVIAIEIDRDLIAGLRSDLPENVEIIEGNALTLDFPSGPFHIAGNLPYNVSTPLLKRFIELRDRIQDVTVMIQKEVAGRLTAKPGGDYGSLSVLIQYYANVKYGFTVRPGAFKPRPKVDSAVIRLNWKPDVPEAREFTDFVQRAFASRRKKLVNNLVHLFPSLDRAEILRHMEEAAVAANARPEELSVSEFLRVYNQFRS